MRINLHEPTFGEEEIAAAVEVMRSTRVTAGDKVRLLEEQFAGEINVECAIMVNSGSSANLLAIAALCDPLAENALRPGDEVIVSALSWSTTVWPLVQCGLTPVIVDIDPETLNIDPEQVAEAIGPRTRAVMPVHVYGNPCDINALIEICNLAELELIEDCCEALGASFEGYPVGSFGTLGTFSFYFSHHITTFEGGMVVTRDVTLEDMLAVKRAHGWVRDIDGSDFIARNPEIDHRFLFVTDGYNLRPTEVAAAIGLVQLPKLAGFVERRQAAATHLLYRLEKYAHIFQFQEVREPAESSWFGFPITIRDGAAIDAKDLRNVLSLNGIENRPLICGNIARQPGMKLFPHRVPFPLTNADRVMDRGFSIPCHQAMGIDECAYIGDVFDRFLG